MFWHIFQPSSDLLPTFPQWLEEVLLEYFLPIFQPSNLKHPILYGTLYSYPLCYPLCYPLLPLLPLSLKDTLYRLEGWKKDASTSGKNASNLIVRGWKMVGRLEGSDWTFRYAKVTVDIIPLVLCHIQPLHGA